jgi:hypothetical protein
MDWKKGIRKCVEVPRSLTRRSLTRSLQAIPSADAPADKMPNEPTLSADAPADKMPDRPTPLLMPLPSSVGLL